MWWITRGQGKGQQNSGKARASAGSRASATPLILSLEPRMLFDGAVAATVAENAAQADSHAATDAAKAPTADNTHASASQDTHAQADATVAASPVAVPGQTVVFVDSRVKDADTLLQGIAPGTQVVKLDASKDGLQQIADYLDQHQGISSVQIIAHGNTGDLWLGNTYLSADNIAARSAVLAQIGQDMNVGGDILIYGCYTAEGDRGLSFVDSLAQLTGRDVAASNDRTGVGGDWDLEIATGSIESVNVLSTKAMSEYQWGLATWQVTSNSDSAAVAGSLRYELNLAQNGDIVAFTSGMTVALNSELVISKNVTIDGDVNNDGVADVTLDGQYKTRVVRVTSGSTVVLDGLVITKGLVSGNGGDGGFGAAGAYGGGIFNAGDLTLKNVTVTANAASGGGGGGGVVPVNAGGGGGGGGGVNGSGGGTGGTAHGTNSPTYSGSAASGGAGGNGGSYDDAHLNGKGGSASGTGGAGGIGTYGYSTGGSGASATNGTISVGGGGGGSGFNQTGGAGGSAAGGIYNAQSGTLKIVGTTAISNNIAAGGGGGGGGGTAAYGGTADNGGAGGRGVGAIWSKGTVLITAANFAALSGNVGVSGNGGLTLGGGSTGTKPTAYSTIFNDGGTLNTAYVEPPTASIVVSNTTQHIGSTSLVTITFSRAVTGFTNTDLTVEGGTLSAVSSSDGGITWTATFTPNANLTDATNVITLDNTGITGVSDGAAGTGTTTSNNYTIDTQRPTVAISMSDTALKVGETSTVTFTFSEAVSGFTNSDLTIQNGTLSAVSSSDGGITWTATFTPNPGTTNATNLITLDNTGVSDASGNAGSGTTNSVNYSIDTQRPTATIVVADSNLSIGETSLVTITFNEAVTGFDLGDMVSQNGTLSNLSTSDGITWTATFTPSSNIRSTSNVITLINTGYTDAAGNTGTGTSTSNNYAIDTQRPTATIVVSDTALKAGETSLVTITFSEAVSGFTNSDLTIQNGTLSAVSSSDGGITWTATFTPNPGTTTATNLITLDNTGVSDAAGNSGSGTTTSNNYAIDTVRPTSTIVVADSALRIGETSLVTITFSEAVSGFSNSNLIVQNGTLSAVSSSDGGITWTATFTPTNNLTDTTNVITLDNTGVSDQAGNAGTGTTTSNNYAIDTARPTATIVVADSNLSAGESTIVTITFSEAVSGFTNADLTVPNGTLSAVSSSDGGITWTATFTPTSNVNDATNIITLSNTGVADLAGNAGAGTTNSNNFVINTVAPVATIVVADPSLTIGETTLVTITFSEAVSGFSNSDVTVANGTLSAVSSNDGGITWTATFTPTNNLTDTTNVITVDNAGVQGQSSGNFGVGTSTSNNYAVDTQRPTATIVVADTALAVGETTTVTITFSEAVTGFTLGDLFVENGTLSNLSSSDGGVTWTATLTPAAGITDNSNLIGLDNAGIQDLAGNAGTGTTLSNNYAIDSVRPTATIVMTDPNLSAGETALVTFTFSEAVTGFTTSDVSAPNGTLSGLSSSDGGITWTATFMPNGNVSDTTNVFTLDNSGISDLAGNTGVGVTNSANFVINTVRPTATIVVADTALAVGETSLVTITFSEAVSGFDNNDLTVANGTLSAVSSNDGGITWTATLTPTANTTDSSNLITLNNSGVQNSAGNSGLGSTDSNNYAIDTQRPTATIVVADAALKAGQTTLVTITFSEAVSGFSNNDLLVENGTLSAISSTDGGITWTATFTPTSAVTDASNVIVLDNTGVADVAGNVGTGITISNNYAIDSQRPTATIVMTDPNLSAGETTLVTFTFSEAVTGFALDDVSAPNGTLSGLSSSDGGITWTATFTPNSNVSDTTNVFTLDNSGISDLAGNTGVGVTNSANFVINTVRPTATIVVADTALAVGETSLVTITFSEAVSGFDNSDLTIANGTLSAVSSSDGGITWTATLTPTANITDSSNLITLNNSGVQNSAGNSGLGSTDSNNYAIDTQRPTATIVVADTALNAGQSTTVTITFSEAVSGFSNNDLLVENGTLSAISSTDGGITWTATFTPTSAVTDASNVIVLDNTGVADAAGNVGTGITTSNNYAIDTQPPTATISLSDTELRPGETSLVTITFNEAVTGLDLTDLSVANGTLSNLSSRDGGVTWTATFTPTTGISDTSNIITLDNSGYVDSAGNSGTGVTNSVNYSVQTLVPTATVVVADSALKAGETSQVTITFSEAVTGFDLSDLSVANGALSNLSSSDGGITWTATLTPTANVTDASNLITLNNAGVQNLAGNTGAGSTDSNNYAIDTARPTATIVVADSTLGIGKTSTVTITFSEAVSGFDLSDLSVANGVLSNLASSDGGKTWTATLTPTANVTDPTNLIVLDTGLVTDAAGNTGAQLAISNNYALDADRPTATIVVANPDLKGGDSTQVTFTFSEAVSGFDLSDLSVANGVLSNLSSSDGGKTWTATLTAASNITDPSNFITLDTSNVSDLAGNAGSGFANSNNYAISLSSQVGDTEFLVRGSVVPSLPSLPDQPLQPTIFAPPTGDLGAPLGFAPLFETRTSGGDLPPVGSIFINNGALAHSFIAQVFGNLSTSDGNGSGFLGFGGGDGGVFGSSTLSGVFNRESGSESSEMKTFDRNNSGKGQGDAAQGLRGVFGAPTLGQQLQQIRDSEQQQLHALAQALGSKQIGAGEVQA